MKQNKIISDPLHGFIELQEDIVLKVIDHPIVQRLRHITQNGLTSFVYPGAVHSRFSHSLGAMKLMDKALHTLQNKGYELSGKEKTASKLAVLLHDTGHAPFSHTLENIFLDGMVHEDISLFAIKKLAEEFAAPELGLAMQIFEGSYHKKALHQLVSSQLDTDRLDYLARDSFYAGVSEGVVSTERIIAMLSALNDEIVFEENGLYSLEKFIIARRMMYWQVYLHKTVLGADYLLKASLKRAVELLNGGEKIFCTANLLPRLLRRISKETLNNDTFGSYLSLDENELWFHLKMWCMEKDTVLSKLAYAICQRKLFHARFLSEALNGEKKYEIVRAIGKKYALNEKETLYFISDETISNHVYKPAEDKIMILKKHGGTVPLTQLSEQINFAAKTETKHFIALPKEFKWLLDTD